jgi:alpha-ribazole phosphatase
LVRDDRLKELNFGTWELQPWDRIDPAELQPWMDNYVDTACPGGESYRQLAARTVDFLSTLKTHPHKNALIVTHHGVIKAISAHLLGVNLEQAMAMTFGYGSVTRYVIEG